MQGDRSGDHGRLCLNRQRSQPGNSRTFALSNERFNDRERSYLDESHDLLF